MHTENMQSGNINAIFALHRPFGDFLKMTYSTSRSWSKLSSFVGRIHIFKRCELSWCTYLRTRKICLAKISKVIFDHYSKGNGLLSILYFLHSENHFLTLIIMKKTYAILIGHRKPWLHHIASILVPHP